MRVIRQKYFSAKEVFKGALLGFGTGVFFGKSVSLAVAAVNKAFGKSYGKAFALTTLGLGIIGAIIGGVTAYSISNIKNKLEDFINWKRKNYKALGRLVKNSIPSKSELNKIKLLVDAEEKFRSLCPIIHHQPDLGYVIRYPQTDAEWIDFVGASLWATNAKNLGIPDVSTIPVVSISLGVDTRKNKPIYYALFDPIKQTYWIDKNKKGSLEDFFYHAVKDSGDNRELGRVTGFKDYNKALLNFIEENL